ncbi:MAG: hypothetical protein KGI19_04965 [Thaumarchaeota archaeon]|nr:hypothetical protein [Nitrososphaerota archaeon]
MTANKEARKILSKKSHCYILPKYSTVSKQKIIQRFKPDVIILDKLKEKTSEIRLLQKNSNLVAIDYTGDNKNMIKNSINMLYQRSAASVNNSFSGFEYTILNKTFQNSRPVHIKKNVRSILVLQGGSDTRCFTPKIIEALNNLKEDFGITVVLGPSFRCWKELKKSTISNKKPLKILHNVKNMSSIMNKHDMAITAGGMSLLELCRLGVPVIVICGEKFENETASLLQKKGFGINLGYGLGVSRNRIAKATKQLLADYDKRKRMNMTGKNTIDGNGTTRVIKIIEKIGVKK